MNIEAVMKQHVVTAHPHTSVRAGLAAMAEAGVRHLPVVDETGLLVGLVSQLDLVRALDRMLVAGGARGDLEVGDVMSVSVFRATRKMPASEAATLMIEHKIGALPVVDGNGRVIGIVSETDFLEIAREALLGVNVEARAHA